MKKYLSLIFNLLIVSIGFSQDLFFSEYAEGSSNNKYLEIYNPTSAAISLDGYAFPSVGNAPTTVGVHEFWNKFTEGATIAAGGVYIIAHPSSDPSILDKANQTHQYLSNGDDGYALAKGTENDHTYIDFVGDFNGDPGDGWNVAGVTEATKDHTLIRKASVVSGNGNTGWTASAGTSTEDSEWLVKDKDDWTNLGSHTYDPSSTQDTDVQFATTSATVNEGDGTASMTVSLSYADPEVGTSVELHLTDGTASDLGDFTFQTLTWDAGNSDDKTVTVTITDDTDIEETETFTFTLKDISGGSENAAIGSKSSFVLTITDNDTPAEPIQDLFYSEYAEGSSNNKYFEIYNPTSETISLDGYAFANTSNGSDGNYEFWNTFAEGATIAAGGVYVIAHKDADPKILENADEQVTLYHNGDDGQALVKGTKEDYVILDRVGDFGPDPGSGWSVAGISNATKDHTLVRKASIVSGNTDWAASAGTSTEDSEWIVKDNNDWTDAGTHTYDGNKSLFYSEYAEGSSNNKYFEIYNPTSETISLDGYAFANTSNGSDGNYEFWNTFAEGATIAAGGVYVIAHKDADPKILENADEQVTLYHNGDDGQALVKGTKEDYVILDRVGDFGPDPGSGWSVAGISNATKDHTLVRKASIVSGNTDWAASAGTSTEDSEWIVKDNNDWSNIGKHNEVVEPNITSVEFSSSNMRLFESDSTIYAVISITNSSTTTSTTVDIVLTSGDATDIGDYTTQTITFEAGNSDADSIAITITDDELTEYKEDFVFELQNIAGGESAVLGNNSSFTLSLDNDDYESTTLILNEFLSDPAPDDENTSEVEGDANGDGIRDGSQDEFIELINSGTESIDLSGFEIHDRTGLRHTFAEGSLLPAGMPYVVFGGGLPSNLDNPLVDTVSTDMLGLNNGGDLIVVKDKSGIEVIIFEYGSISHGGANDLRGDQNQSVTRDPDITGDFVLHSNTASGLAFSPGLKNDNVSFDADGDGVADDYDTCPDTPEGETVDENGCSDSQKDTDGDGVTDDIDECANTPSGAAVDSKGCELPLFVEKVSFVNKIYPNPASEILKVELDNSMILNKYVINDLNGKVIEATKIGQKLKYLEIDIKSFNNGLFILNLEFEKGNSKVKFLKE